MRLHVLAGLAAPIRHRVPADVQDSHEDGCQPDQLNFDSGKHEFAILPAA